MKRLLPLLLFLLLCCAVQSHAGMNAYIAGSVASSAALSCTTSDDSKIWNPVTQPGTSVDVSTYTAIKIVLSSTTRITSYKIRLGNPGGSTGSCTAELYNDDGNGATSKPTTAVADSSKNVAAGDIETASHVEDFDLATPLQVNAGTYWIVRYEVDSANLSSYYVSSTGDRVCYSTNGSTWTCIDDTSYDKELWGCQ